MVLATAMQRGMLLRGATGAAARRAAAGARRGLSEQRGPQAAGQQQAQPEEYHVPVPRSKNLAVAGVLSLFVVATYFYTVQRIQTNVELGEEFTQVFKSDKADDAQPAAK